VKGRFKWEFGDARSIQVMRRGSTVSRSMSSQFECEHGSLLYSSTSRLFHLTRPTASMMISIHAESVSLKPRAAAVRRDN